MNNKAFLTSDDFQGQSRSINMESFTNLSKGITESEFREKYPNVDIFTQTGLSQFAKDIRAKASEVIEKGEDGETGADILSKGAEFVNSLTKVTVRGENGDVDLFVREKEAVIEKAQKNDKFEAVMREFKDGKLHNVSGEVVEKRSQALAIAASEAGLTKGEESDVLIKGWLESNIEDTLEKGDDAPSKDDLIKGELSDAISYNGLGGAKFKKTGKEIKEALSKLEEKIEEKIGTLKEKQEELIEKIGLHPTEKLDNWQKRGLGKEADDMKRFPWEMTYCNTENGKMNSGSDTYMPSSGKMVEEVRKSASCQEEANNCREYNRLVEDCVSACQDLQKSGVFSRNIDEKKTYELNLSELSALGF